MSYTYTDPKNNTKTFTFSKEQIKHLQDEYKKACSIADTVDTYSNLDGYWAEAVNAIFRGHMDSSIKGCPDFYQYQDEEPFIEWFKSIELEK